MKTIIFILAISAIATPIFADTCTGAAANGATNCVSCRNTDTTKCNACAAGYWLTQTQTCSLCPSTKGKAADTAITTDAAGTADGNTVCGVTSTGGCNVNNGVAGECLNCKAGYYLSAAKTCAWCTGGKGKDADTTVPAVDASGATCTATCTAASNCGACSAAAAGTCLACAAGRYLKTADNTCAACTAGCKTCTDTGLDKCPTCADGFYYSAANTCAACGMGLWRTAPATAPTTAEAATVCTICAKDTYYTATGCTNCPAGKTRTAPTEAPKAVEADTVCSAAGGSGSSATLIQALCGASVAAYALF